MICAINTIKAQIITKNLKMLAQKITHWSQWEIAEVCTFLLAVSNLFAYTVALQAYKFNIGGHL